jgi:hypothetical protein
MVIHSRGASAVTKCFYVCIDLVAVLGARVLGCNLKPLAGFEIDQNGGLVKIGPDFLRIEDVKQENLVSSEAQGLNGANDLLGRFIEIRDDENQATASEELLKVVERLAEVGASPRFGQLESA